MYLCGFKCLFGCVLQWSIRLRVLHELMLGTNEILASKHDTAALKVKQGHFETAILVLHNFALFYHG